MSVESQRSIADWADFTFGPCSKRIHAVRRARQEMNEFIALHTDMIDELPVSDRQLVDEAADVVITLFRLAHVLKADLMSRVDTKMVINRQRRWQSDGTGHGQHIKDEF